MQVTSRAVNNLALDYRGGAPDGGHGIEASLYYGAKFVRGKFGDDVYEGFVAGHADRGGDRRQPAVAKSSTVVADQVSTLNPKALPGSDIDFSLVVTNPSQNALATVDKVVIADTVPTQAKLRVTDYGAAGGGPVGVVDGSLIGAGVVASGLAYSYLGLASTTDGLEFWPTAPPGPTCRSPMPTVRHAGPRRPGDAVRHASRRPHVQVAVSH